MVKVVGLMKGGKGMNEKILLGTSSCLLKGDMVAIDNSLFF